MPSPRRCVEVCLRRRRSQLPETESLTFAALDCIAFRPRVLRNVSGTDLTTTFIGTKQRMPVLLAPLASLTVRSEK